MHLASARLEEEFFVSQDIINAGQPVAIVTGGTHGIGRATVAALSQAGWLVAFQGRSKTEGREIAADREGLYYVPGDLADERTIRSLVACAEDLGKGRIDGLVSNAGVGVRKRFEDCEASDWDQLFAINTRAAFLVTRAALARLRMARGSVVFISSVAGSGGESGLSIYSASKAALIGFAKTLVIELGEEVRFNVLCAGQIATRMMAGALESLNFATPFLRVSRCGGSAKRTKSRPSWPFYSRLHRPTLTALSFLLRAARLRASRTSR
jgi:NAD(P)-dependent dehydrogenase (short-subunit alcohol dehydrogenase family)